MGVRISQWSPTRIRNGFTKGSQRVALPRMSPIAAGDLPLTRLGSSEDARLVPVGFLEEGSICYCVGDSVTFDLASSAGLPRRRIRSDAGVD